MGNPVIRTKSHVQGGFTGIRVLMVHIGSLFDQELTQPPMAMKGRPLEVEIVTQLMNRFPGLQ